MKPICVCWKTSRNAKASHFERLPRPGEVARKCQKGTRWHGEAVTERARMLTKSKKRSDTSPVCQRHRIAVLSCFILPGLPSQALARQLSQRGSPWQRGDVFDETDWGLLENVTGCQSLSLWERWHGEAVTERASRLYSFSHASKTACLFSRSFLRSRRPSIENRAAGIGSP